MPMFYGTLRLVAGTLILLGAGCTSQLYRADAHSRPLSEHLAALTEFKVIVEEYPATFDPFAMVLQINDSGDLFFDAIGHLTRSSMLSELMANWKKDGNKPLRVYLLVDGYENDVTMKGLQRNLMVLYENYEKNEEHFSVHVILVLRWHSPKL